MHEEWRLTRLMLTFLQFFCSHCRTCSKPCIISGDWKNSTFGPPSFFGPNRAISHAQFSTNLQEKIYFSLHFTWISHTTPNETQTLVFSIWMAYKKAKMATIRQTQHLPPGGLCRRQNSQNGLRLFGRHFGPIHELCFGSSVKMRKFCTKFMFI